MKDDGFDEGRRNRDEGQGFLEQRDFCPDSLAVLPKVTSFKKRSKKKNVPHLQGVDRYNRI